MIRGQFRYGTYSGRAAITEKRGYASYCAVGGPNHATSASRRP
jgi:hypothetical protein